LKITPAPPPIRRSSLFLPHFGHFFFGASFIEWKISSEWPQPLQA
jgi:hypothetical protein